MKDLDPNRKERKVTCKLIPHEHEYKIQTFDYQGIRNSNHNKYI